MNLVGLDLGQTNDPSALSVFTRREFPAPAPAPLPPRPEPYGPERPPPDPSWDVADPGLAARHAAEMRRWKELSPVVAGDRRFDAAEDLAQAPKPPPMERRYLGRMLRKWPLGYSYVKVVAEVRTLCAHPMLQVDMATGAIRPPTLVIDATGLGAPVFDMFRAARVPAVLIGIVITGGDKIRQDPDVKNLFHVPKYVLVNVVQVLLQSARLDFPPKLKDPVTGEDMQAAMMDELKAFRQDQITSAKRGKVHTTYEAEPGSHDDVLMCVSYALWWGERAGRTPKVW